MVAPVHPMHLLESGVCSLIEIERELDVVTDPFFPWSQLAILITGEYWRDQKQSDKEISTTEDTEKSERDTKPLSNFFSVSSVVKFISHSRSPAEL